MVFITINRGQTLGDKSNKRSAHFLNECQFGGINSLTHKSTTHINNVCKVKTILKDYVDHAECIWDPSTIIRTCALYRKYMCTNVCKFMH